MESYTYVLIIFSFACMVVTGGVIFMHLMVCRELDALKPEAKKDKERAESLDRSLSEREEEVNRLEKENGKLSTDLFLARDAIKRLRVRAGEITPDGRSIPRNERVLWIQP